MRVTPRLLVAATAAVIAGGFVSTTAAFHGAGTADRLGAIASSTPGRHLTSLGTVNLTSMTRGTHTGSASTRYSIQPEAERKPGLSSLVPKLTLGGSTAPASPVVTDPPSTDGSGGWNGINILEMEKAGTGSYSGTNGGLEPPDQALCVGNGFVMEGVNTAWRIYTTAGTPLAPAVPITQFFKIAPGAQLTTPSSFVSDPRCVYDATTKRFFALTLEADEASGLSGEPFLRAHTYFAVSKTSDPTGDWYIYNVDITDDGTMGTPMHVSCPCIDDQPLMGIDANGLYLSANEYSDSELFPVAPPNQVYNVINTLPDYRNGQAQVYALSKADLINGINAPLQAFDTKNTPLPAADQSTTGALWSSLQPAQSPPGDGTAEPSQGVEYFMSQLDFASTGDNRVAVWALTDTSSLNSATPNVALQNTVISTLNPATETYVSPFSSPTGGGVSQKAGPTPLGDTCGCKEELLNSNDDRMNQVMLTNGTLWSGVNTTLANDSAGKPRTGVMYFNVRPGLDPQGHVTAAMVRDGYVQVANGSTLFPSIAATPQGAVEMFFSVSGVDYYPSTAYTRLDDLAVNGDSSGAPIVHISAAGYAPEDGFTGYPESDQVTPIVGIPLDPSQGANGVSRWGDYSAAAVDENGCAWGASEYIPNEARDAAAGDWGTYITHVSPSTCTPGIITPVTSNACQPLFTDPAGDDVEGNGLAPVAATRGQNPQLDILSGDMKVAADGSTVSTILTINNLSKTLPTGGQANDYYFYWTYKGTIYYTLAQVDSSGNTTFVDGTDSSSGRSPRSGGPADSGALVLGANGTVTVTVPASVVGSPQPGQTLLGPNAETRELEGDASQGLGLVVQYDAAGPNADFIVGASCLAANVAEAPFSAGLPLAAGAIGFGIVMWRRRRRRAQTV